MKNQIMSLCFGLALLAGCNDQNANIKIPDAIAMTEEAVGHYCQMNILEHTGPKAQIHLKHNPNPLFFSQVRDAIAFTRMPEETHEPIAIYVNDMGSAEDWDFPGDDTWISIESAYFIINSDRIGGMGAPETIPFGTNESAMKFQAEFGGDVVSLDDIPDEYVLGPVEIDLQTRTTAGAVE